MLLPGQFSLRDSQRERKREVGVWRGLIDRQERLKTRSQKTGERTAPVKWKSETNIKTLTVLGAEQTINTFNKKAMNE